jgi:hypothetical protein
MKQQQAEQQLQETQPVSRTASLQGTFHNEVTGETVSFTELDHHGGDLSTGYEEYTEVQGDDGQTYYINEVGDVADSNQEVVGFFDRGQDPDDDRHDWGEEPYPDWTESKVGEVTDAETRCPECGSHTCRAFKEEGMDTPQLKCLNCGNEFGASLYRSPESKKSGWTRESLDYPEDPNLQNEIVELCKQIAMNYGDSRELSVLKEKLEQLLGGNPHMAASGKHDAGTRVELNHKNLHGKGTILECSGKHDDLSEELYEIQLDNGERVKDIPESAFSRIKSAGKEADRKDYEHWNEDADRMWWEEEGKHQDDPEYNPDDYQHSKDPFWFWAEEADEQELVNALEAGDWKGRPLTPEQETGIRDLLYNEWGVDYNLLNGNHGDASEYSEQQHFQQDPYSSSTKKADFTGKLPPLTPEQKTELEREIQLLESGGEPQGVLSKIMEAMNTPWAGDKFAFAGIVGYIAHHYGLFHALGKVAFVKDSNGNDLETGGWYTMYSNKYKVPDVVQILNLDDLRIEAAIEGDEKRMFPITISASDLDKEGYSFEPYVILEKKADVQDQFGWKLARHGFNASEQRKLIEENPDGRARNIEKMDLDGTHYTTWRLIENDDLESSFLWG